MKKSYYILVLSGVIIIWEVFALLFNIRILPTPFEIIRNLINIFNEEIFIHLLYSLRRIILGLIIGCSLSFVIGTMSGFFEKANIIFTPIFYFSYPIPKFSLLPIIILFFGLGEISKIVMVVIVIFFPMTVSIKDSCELFASKYYDTFNAAGISKLKFVIFCMLKGILPSIFTSLRIGVGTALSVLFFAENFASRYGIGYYIMNAWIRIDYLDMYTGITVMSLMGILMFIIIDFVSKKVCTFLN